MAETTLARTAYETHMHAEAAAYLRSEQARAMATQGKGWDTLTDVQRSVWGETAQATIAAATALGIFTVTVDDEHRVSLPAPIHLGPGIAMSTHPEGGTTLERTDVITDRAELASAIAKLEEIRRLCHAGGQHGQVWGGKPRQAGDPLAGIILDIIGQDPKPDEAQINTLTAERDEARADRDSYAERLRATDKSWTELACERDALRDLIAEILSEFDGKGHLDGRHASVGIVQLGKWRDRAGLNSTDSEPQGST